MREATCAAPLTSKVPTEVGLLLYPYSVLWRSSPSLQRTQNKPQEKNGYQQSTKPAVSHNQSINYKMSHKRARHSIGTSINSDDCAHQCRLSARQLIKQPHVKQSRDREPSRLPLKRIVFISFEKEKK